MKKLLFVMFALTLVSFVGNAQTIDTVAGGGSLSPSAAEGGSALNVELLSPDFVVVDGNGNFYFSDLTHNRVFKVDTSGNITTFAGTGNQGFSGDSGPATSADLYFPRGITVDSNGNVYFSDSGNDRIRKVDTSGTITTVTINGGNLFGPRGLDIDSQGNLYIADNVNEVIRKVDASTGDISTIAGQVLTSGFSGDGGLATNALLNSPRDVVVDDNGNVYFSDGQNHVIRRVDASTGMIQTIAGQGTLLGFEGDGGPATSAKLWLPNGIFIDSNGNVIIADTVNNRIRKVDTNGTITTIAGDGFGGFGGDGGPAIDAWLWTPGGIAGDNNGNLYISDSSNLRIRKITPAAPAPPTDITLDNNTVNEDEATGTLVGTLDAVDADGSDTHTFTLVAGTGASGNGSFTISGDQLLSNAVFDYETQSSYSIRVQADDNNGGVFEKQLTIQVLDVNELPILSLVPAGDILRGETQEFAVNISDAAGIIGFRIALDFDPAQASYVDSSATKVGTLTENGWFDIIVNASSSNQLIFTSAALTEPLPAGSSGDLFKFSLAFASNLSDFEVVNIDFNQSLTDINDGGFAFAEQNLVDEVEPINDPPSFTKGPDQTVFEDSGTHVINNWATNISKGTFEEAGQTLIFNVTPSNPSLFVSTPTIDDTGTLTFTPAADQFGSSTIEVVLEDDGGTFNGGDETSDPQTFVINVDPVNDPPSFTKGPDQSVLEDSGTHVITNWATNLSLGNSELAGQALVFNVTPSNPSLFVSTPTIDDSGTLTFTPAANQFGSSTIEVVLQDDGGTLNGGDDTSDPQTFVIDVEPVNDSPSFTKGPDQSVLEDSGTHEITNWATAISIGTPEEVGQTLIFNVTPSNPSLFVSIPTIDDSGTLTFTPAADQFGSSTIEVVLEDDGGTFNGGDETSDPQTFVIEVLPVNDQPSFSLGVASATREVLNDTGAPRDIAGYATDISPGPSNENTQTLEFIMGTDQPQLFASTPAINASNGTLSYTPAVDEHGIANVTAVLKDDGGTVNGGVDATSPFEFQIYMFIPFQWGELDGNGIAGTVDASLLLQFDNFTIFGTDFPAYPPSEFPEYELSDTVFPPAADVSNDGAAGTLDASLILQQYALLITYFPADGDTDNFGPDPFDLGGKVMAQSRANRALSVSIQPISGQSNAWNLIFSVDDANTLAGMRLALSYDANELEIVDGDTEWMVPGGLVVTNNQQPGHFILSGALTNPLEAGPADLMKVSVQAKDGVNPSQGFTIQVDQELTQLNDGLIELGTNSLKSFNVPEGTAVSTWMVY